MKKKMIDSPKTLLNFNNYRDYLIHLIGPTGTRSGIRTEIAKALHCNNSLVTLILQGKLDLSLEQGEILNDFFNHNEIESHYFLDLISYERAGSEKLKKRMKNRLIQRLKVANKIKNRIEKSELISEKDKELFYSDALYCILHVLTSLPNLDSISDYAKRLRLPEGAIKEALLFLESIKLIEKNGRKYQMTKNHIHLPNESPSIIHHHKNLRELCMQSLSRRESSDLHYSLCFSISEKDLETLRLDLLEFFQKMTKKISTSREEKIAVFNLDLFNPLR